MVKFAFMIHPLDIADVARKYSITKYLPEKLVAGVVRAMPPVKASVITGIRSPYAETEGWFVACPLTTKQMQMLPTDYVIKKIIRTGKLAEKLGARVLGLGAMTSVVGDAGVTVAKNLNLAVTTGNSYTVAMALDATKAAAKIMDIDLKSAQITVIGATGSIGAVCAQVLSRDVNHLTLVARNTEKLDHLARKIYQESGLVCNIVKNTKKAVKNADVILTVTSSAEAIIEPEDIKLGAVICDVARPRDVSKRVAEIRDDVLVVEGGVVEVPGNDVDFNFDFGYPPGTALACMAETMILALEKRFENYTLGRELSLEKVDGINHLAQKHGFKLAGLRSFERPLTACKIKAIKDKVYQRKKMTAHV